MRQRLMLLSVAQLLPRFQRRQQEVEDERRIARIILETGGSEKDARASLRLVSRSADGHDPARLRGLPAIGRNVSGEIPGTNPLAALLRKEARGELRR